MKYAIYDKAADGYLTKMEFEVGYSEHTQFECGYNEYITEAQLLDTPKEAADAIVRIESFKFMEKGRFVAHSFDDTLKDQYIISEAGNPTKVVDNITVDLEGTINVKYGTMAFHWSTAFLEYAINRMNALQKAIRPVYTSWCNTFDIYKVITVMDERSCNHYQFIKVTEKGLTEYAKDEVLVVGKEITDITEPLNKRIEELEKTNYELGQTATARGATANRLQEENNNLKNRVAAIKKDARNWKYLYEKAGKDRETLMNVIDNIYDDLGSVDICKDLRDTYDYVKGLSELNYIMAHNDDTDDGKPIYITAAAEFKYIIDRVIAIIKERTDWKRRAEEAIRDYTRCNEALGEWKRKRRANDKDYEMLKNKLEACEIVLESTKASLTVVTGERDKALERAEFCKRMANSVYGMIIPGRCCGKQMFCDITTGKKILVDKKKYDDLVEYVANVNLTYDNMFCMMDKPVYLSTITESLNDLTK